MTRDEWLREQVSAPSFKLVRRAMPAAPRDYYNRRHGHDGQPPRLTLPEVARQVAAIYRTSDANGHLQRAFGYQCVDAGQVPGEIGADFRMELFMRTGIRISGVVAEAIEQADEVTLFTILEFVYDHIAKPLQGEGRLHSWDNCGFHFDHTRDKSDEQVGRAEWRNRINGVLKFYEDGYEISADGEIVHLAPDGMATLIATPPPTGTKDIDAAKLANAVRTFRLGRSTREQRKQAVRDLADILEYHRHDVASYIGEGSKKDLFNIANNFAIRHHNSFQRDDYDDAWLTWMFFTYLASVHMVLGRVAGTEPFAEKSPEPPEPIVDDCDIPF